ncbi:unnamed protein product [Leptidea sinapis]|uniref:uridine/cytidine kinase n=1 Tax=Leptidea sinapis TaxID=189913 RepID=A0A5E4Q2F4_9NEOP|nr:unnamed protein product [Leptidea sinapis]
MLLSAVIRHSRAVSVCNILGLGITRNYNLKHKMGENTADNVKTNGFESKTPFLIGVAGGTASGKSTVCQKIMEKLGQQQKQQTDRRVVCISQDSFYRSLTPSERLRAERGQFNFDHPDAFDDKKLLAVLKDILAGKKVEVPEYNYITNSISDRSHTIYPADVVLIEGILVFYFPETKKFADVIIPRGADNIVAIDLIVHHIWDIMYKKGPKIVNGCNGHAEDEPNERRMSGSSEDTLIAIDLIVQHISEYLKRSPDAKQMLDYAGISSVPGSPQRTGKSGRPH